MSRFNRRARTTVGALCLFGLVFAACGSDDGEAADTTAAAEEAADTTAAVEEAADTTAAAEEAADTTVAAEEEMAAPTGTPVKIGIVFSETGRTAATYGATGPLALAWAEWVNAEMGGVNGHPIEVVAKDGASTGEGALAAANELIAEGVVGIVIQDSTAENAIAEAITTAGIPMIGGTANGRPSDTGEAHWPNTYFNTAPSNPATAASTMMAAAASGAKTYAAAVCSEVPACAEAGKLYEPVAPSLGLEYVGLVTVGAADPSYTAPCLELVGKGTEVINLGLAPQTGIAVIDECNLQGYTGMYSAANNSVTASTFEGVAGLHLIGALNGFPWWADAPAAQQFRDVAAEYASDLDVRDPSSTTTWSALELFRKAMTDHGPAADAAVTAADVVSTYQQVKGETLDGLLPQAVTYVADGFQPLLNCFWLFDMTDGVFTSSNLGDSGNGATGDLQTTCFG